MMKTKSKLSTLMQNFIIIILLALLSLLLVFTYNPFEKNDSTSPLVIAATWPTGEDGNALTLEEFVTTQGGNDITLDSEGYHIFTPRGLEVLSDYTAAGEPFDPSWKFYLENDLDMIDYENISIGSPFFGLFDGKGHTISHLNITSYGVEESVQALFPLTCLCTIINLNIVEDREISLTQSQYFGGLVGIVFAETLIANCSVEYNSIKVETQSYMCGGGLVGMLLTEGGVSKLTITNCDVTIHNLQTHMIFGGILGAVRQDRSDVTLLQVDISRCMVRIGTLTTAPYQASAGSIQIVVGGVIGGVSIEGSNTLASCSLNQIYVEFGSAELSGSMNLIGGLVGMAGERTGLSYSETMVIGNWILPEGVAVKKAAYDWATFGADGYTVSGTNSYFNIQCTETATFYDTASMAGVFDVARKQYYSGFSDNQWLVFPDKHPTIREFMAVGDFATVQSVEDKLIELGYTKVM